MNKTSGFVRVSILIAIILGILLLGSMGYLFVYNHSTTPNVPVVTTAVDGVNIDNLSNTSENNPGNSPSDSTQIQLASNNSVDLCANIEGIQTTIPVGMNLTGTTCATISPTNNSVDVCINIQGVQTSVPVGMVLQSGLCASYSSLDQTPPPVVAPTPVIDLCTNIQGNQSSVPEGMSASGGICTSNQTQTNTQSATPPIVLADPDKSVTNPSSQILISGSISGNTTGLTWAWSKVSGNDNVSLNNTGFAQATINYNGITTSGTHNYTFRLTATNSQGGTAYDDINVSIILTPLAPTVETTYPSWNGSHSNTNKWNGQYASNRAETTVWFEFGSSPTSLNYRTIDVTYPASFPGNIFSQNININDIHELWEAGHFVIYFRLIAKNSVGTSYGDILNYNFHN